MGFYKNDRDQYRCVMGKRAALEAAGEWSIPDGPDTDVSILVPFIENYSENPADSRDNYEEQTATLVDHYTRQERNAHVVMDATPQDFEDVLTDKRIPTVVIAGTGGFSFVAVPLDKSHSGKFANLDWLHISGMATHLKLGNFVMAMCGSFDRETNVPLPVGAADSFSHIIAAPNVDPKSHEYSELAKVIRPITDKRDLGFDEIKEQFPLDRNPDILSAMPDGAYLTLRGLRDRLRRGREQRGLRQVNLSHPNLREYRSQGTQWVQRT